MGFSPPSRIGRYTVGEEIGRGGSGVVYRAQDPLIGRTVALKILDVPPGMEGAESATCRFLEEARVVARLDHQNIVAVHDYGRDGNLHYLVMRLVRGRSLAAQIRVDGPMPVQRVLSVTRHVLRALRYAHRHGVLHRDVKSSNILLEGDDGPALLGDFGIALAPESPRLTTQGVALGTPEYMSPEQCRGQALDERSDIYSLGIVLWETLCGTPPFTGEAAIEIAYRQVHETLPSLPREGVPEGLRRVLARALSKRPDDRYPNAVAMLEDFDTLSGPPSRKLVVTPSERRRNDRRGPERRARDRRTSIQGTAPHGSRPLFTDPVFWLALTAALASVVGIVLDR